MTTPPEDRSPRSALSRALEDKLADLAVGAALEVDPDEADALGAFREDALSEEEARASSLDLEP
jgi:hypothetical protein